MLGGRFRTAAISLTVSGLVALLAAPTRAQFLVEGLQGPVTAAEVQAFKQEMRAKLAVKEGLGPFNVFVGNRRNNYVYGLTADAVEGLLAMYQLTDDQELLDQLIWYTDQMLLHRNDRFRKWTMFTGKVEPCWPNCPEDTPACQWYCGTEVGDVVGHIAAVAVLLIQHRDLWPRPVAGEDPLGLGRTYLDRARGYLRECRVTLDDFLTPHFVHPQTRRFIWPVHPNYGDGTEKSIRARGKTVPWNQNTMLANGYLNVAVALELLGEEPATVAAYDAIVKAFTDAFFEKITRYTVMDQPVYNWSYASDDVGPDYRYDEDVGHAGYDFWGMYRAYARGKAGISREAMLPFANTIRHVILRPDGVSTANRVNGEGPDRAGLGSTWIYGAYLRPELYEVIGGAMVNGARRDPMTAGRLLLAKHHKANDWRIGPMTTGDGGPTPMTPADAGGAPVVARDAAGAADSGRGPPAPPERATDAAAPQAADTAAPPPVDASRGTGGRGGSGGAPPPPSDSPPPRGSAGGCACGTAASSSGGGLYAALGVAALLTRSRLRRRARSTQQ